MLSLAVDAKDSITMAINYPNGQPQQKDPTGEHELKYNQLFKTDFLPTCPASYSRQVWFRPEGLSCFNNIKTVARKRS